MVPSAFLLFARLATQEPVAASSYSLPHTEVITLERPDIGGEHVLYVSLPRGYETTTRRYPVVLLLDPDYSFAIAHNVVEHFVDRGNLQPVILVGVGYPGQSQDALAYRRHRTRDYTPTRTLEGGYGPQLQKFSGGAPKFLDFLATQLLPALDSRYRLDGDRTLVGHSYGGLFATYVLLTRPELFDRYLAVSPSYWYDDGYIFGLEERAAARLEPIEARVALYIGARENPPNIELTMVDDLRAFGEKLRSRDYTGLALETEVFEHETHNSVFPAALTRGLLWLFGPSPPRPED